MVTSPIMISDRFNDLENAYTDSPKLHANLIIGSLQILFWLLFHPSAWRNHIATIDSDLSPNFGLTDLNQAQWNNKQLRRFLAMGYFIIPLIASIAASIILWLLEMQPWNIMLGVGIGLVLGMGVGLTGNVVVGSAASVGIGSIIGLVGGVGAGVGLGLGVVVTTDSGEIDVVSRAYTLSTLFGLIFGIGGTLIGGLTSSVLGNTTRLSSKQLGPILIGTIFAGLMLFAGGRSLADGQNNIFITGVLVSSLVVIAVAWRRTLIAGLIVGLMTAIAFPVAYILPGDTALNAVLFIALIIPPYLLVESMAGPWPGAIASSFGGGSGWAASAILASGLSLWPYLPVGMLTILLGLSFFFLRPIILYPFLTIWNTIIRRLDENRADDMPSRLRWHAAFWDELQRLRLFGLEDHLLMISERRPTEAQAALEYLASSQQRWAAQAAQIEIDARWLENCTTVEVIGSVHHSLLAGDLEGSANALLRSFSRISQDVEAALRQETAYNQRLALSMLEDRLDGLLRELTRSNEKYASRFRPIAGNWRQTIAQQVQKLADDVEIRQEIDNPYIIGVPLTEQQEIFVGRTNISTHIERLILDQRSPPLLLYGQRRMGKTSLLNNLGRLLPTTIVPLFVDLQGPISWASDYTGFLYNLARAMRDSALRQRGLQLTRLTREDLDPDPFTIFDEWLDHVEESLGQNTALLSLDEFEALDSAIAKGNYDEDAILGTLRHIIQHRTRFKVMLAGSHSIDELKRWANYLINAQVVHIGFLDEVETRQLIERPVRDFALRYEPAASERVMELTQGHPFLVQLLCAEIVAIKNEQPPAIRRTASLADVEASVVEALNRGSLFFSDIEQNQIDSISLDILRTIAMHGQNGAIDQAVLHKHVNQPDILNAGIERLKQRELIEPMPNGYRFRVPLICRWFALQTA